jgi:hypothetical protein
MIGVRIAGGALIAGTAAAAIGCSPATDRPATPVTSATLATPGTATVVSEHPSETSDRPAKPSSRYRLSHRCTLSGAVTRFRYFHLRFRGGA